MLTVKTKIKESAIAGIGLFADQLIPKGTTVWKFQKGFDIELSKAQFAELSEPAQEQVLNYCYFDSKKEMYVICGDDARFFNHSDNPNVSSSPYDDRPDFALRDIQIGEELTQNYNNFDGQVGEKLHHA